MKIWNWINNLFIEEESQSFEPRATGVLDNDEDYRDIYLGSFQKPVGAPNSTGLKTLKILNKLPSLDQKRLGICVVCAFAKLLMLYIYRKTGKTANISFRMAWQICKLFDGAGKYGTYPRIGGLVFTKYGCCTEDLLKSDTDLSIDKFVDFKMTLEMLEEARKHRFAGFAFVDKNIEAIKEAIYQNGAVVGTTETGGGWMSLPLKSENSSGPHYTVWCDYEDLSNGDTKIYIDNSWGPKWLSWVIKWLFPGKGYFLWSQHKETVRDIIACTEIPENLLNEAKKSPYKFVKSLQAGQMGPAVLELQKFLNENPHTAVALEGSGSPGNETTFFGTATLNAVKKWQMMKGLPPTGFFGDLSISKANERIKTMNLIDALIKVESGGDDNAIGDKHLKHKAYGCLQIRQPYMDDALPGRKSQECLGNRALSIQAFEAYMKRYEPNGTDEEKARAHNAGPSWRLKRSITDGYWNKVKVLLNK